MSYIKDKILVKRKLCYKYWPEERYEIRFKDIAESLNEDLQPDDIIDIENDPGYYSENNSWDPCTRLTIYREELETDEEYNERESEWNKILEDGKKRRYESYLKLKQEFEPND